MDYKQLKREIKEIADIAASVPESLREKCFEVMLNHLLAGQREEEKEEEGTGRRRGERVGIELPSHVRAFMRRNDITLEQIESIVMLEGDDLHFIKEPTTKKVAKGQSDWALLIALKNGILKDSLKADPEEVRSIVQEKGLYDAANFAANFKKKKHAGLFRSPLEPQGTPQALSRAGETELANLIKQLAS